MITQYLKVPSRTYRGSELNKLEQSQQEESDNEIDKLYKEAGYSKGPSQEDLEITSVVTWMRIPKEEFENCSYDASTAIEDADEEFFAGSFSSSVIHFKDGISLPCAWSVDKLEDFLIENELVHKSIKDQKEIL